MKKNGMKTAVMIFAVLMTAGAVFTGAVAAEGETPENSIVPDWSKTLAPNALFYYENVCGLTGSYTNMDETLTLDGMKVLDAVENYPTGIYLNADVGHSGQPAQINLQKLDALIKMYVYNDDGSKIIKSCIGGTVPQGAKVSFVPDMPHTTKYFTDGLENVCLKFIGPDGSGESTRLGEIDYGFKVTKNTRWGIRDLDPNLKEGTWTVWAYFKPVGTTGYFADYTDDEYLNGAKYQFTVTSPTVSLTADTETAKVEGYVTITISGKPDAAYYLKPNEMYEVNPGQDNFKYQAGPTEVAGDNVVTIGRKGTTTLTLKALKSGSFTLQLCDKDVRSIVKEDLQLKFTKAEITAEVEKDQYYMGTDVKLTGTNEAGYPLYYYIEGTNLKFSKINTNNLEQKNITNWETTIKGKFFTSPKLDTAAYTIFISNVNDPNDVKDNVIASDAVYTAVGVNLVKPEIRVTSAPSVVTHGDKLTVKGVADSAANVRYYIFGTNKFYPGKVDVGKNGAFTIEKTITKEDYNAGQYYVVLQHPMYDTYYNIAPVETPANSSIWFIKLSNTGDATTAADAKTLFSLNERQSANAAQALCDAIDSEDIDDICTKFSFIVTAEGTEIGPIPSQVIKGLPLTVSGKTNKVDGDPVIVELLSTMFTAASKYSPTSASFITLTATPDEHGEWVVTFNTNNLNVDEYTVTVKTGTVTSNPAYVEIIEGQIPVPAYPASTETTPQSPTAAPVNPTEQAKSPGFGIAAVLAGLGVAVLLRKRA